MKLRINKRIFSWNLINEKGVIVAKIRNQKLIGTAKEICDYNGKVVFTANIVNIPIKNEAWNCADTKKYVIFKDGKTVATANLYFAKNPKRMKIHKLLLRPPQVDGMNIETPFGIWIIQRQKNNALTVNCDGVLMGSVTPFYTFKPIYLEFTEKYEPTFWAAVFVLIDYMMHEDNLIIL